MSKVSLNFKKVTSRIEKALNDVVGKKAMIAMGQFARELIVKRTRLGYGVEDNFAPRKKLGALKASYVKQRSMFEGLDSTTRPKKSNLTRTGEMLESLESKYVRKGLVLIEPKGARNRKVALYNTQEVTYANGYTKPARIFNRVSDNEYRQILRFYRKTFGDLLKKYSVIK
jgi:hypothetical protein